MRLKDRLVHWMQRIEFGFLLPFISKMPICIGDPLSRIRGIFHALIDFDWRAKAIGHDYVKRQTFLAMQTMRPDSSSLRKGLFTWQRFIYNSKEEWQAALFGNPRAMNRISRKSRIDNLDYLLENQRKKIGQVLISCHFDSFCLGMTLMGLQGLKVNVVNTSSIEDERIHPTVRDFFLKKYRNMERLMHGRMPYYQQEMSYFYHALDRGEVVTLMGDIPGSKSDISIPFLNSEFKLPLGAWHMARETRSLIGGYMVVQTGLGAYRVVSFKPREIDPEDPCLTLKPIYEFMQDWILKMPQRWVSADLLPGYKGIEE